MKIFSRLIPVLLMLLVPPLARAATITGLNLIQQSGITIRQTNNPTLGTVDTAISNNFQNVPGLTLTNLSTQGLTNNLPVEFTTLTVTPGTGVASTNYIDCSTNAVQYLTNFTVGSVYLHSTNRLNIVGARSIVAWLISSTNVTYNFNTSWRTIGTNNVFYVSSNKLTIVTLMLNGTGETNVTAGYGIQF